VSRAVQPFFGTENSASETDKIRPAARRPSACP